MLRSLTVAVVGLGALGLMAGTSLPAQAAGAHLPPALHVLPVESNLIEVQTWKRKASPRRAAPSRRAAPPRRAAPSQRWSRDRRHRYHGGFFAVPFGFTLYAAHPCYDWRRGPRGWGYHWNYRRCPV